MRSALVLTLVVSACTRMPAPGRGRAPGSPAAAPEVGVWADGRVAAGSTHSCALRGGRVMCWGGNSGGQLGDGSRVSRAVPVWVDGVADASAVAVGYGYSCALGGGAVTCWGEWDTRAAPVLHVVRGLDDAVELAVSAWYACARRRGGGVLCWDRSTNTPAALPEVNDARGLAAGFSHLCVLRGWGGVECFLPADRNQPYGVPVSLGTVPGLTGALALAASGSTACALGADRRVRCWNIREDTRRMSGLVDLGVEGALDLAGGDEVCVAYARSAGCLRDVWPDEAGAVHAELHEKAGLRQLSALSSGGLRWCGQRADGALVCWGSDDGTLGRYSQFESQPVPLAVAGLASAAELAVIERGVCARRSDGRVLCWGGSEVAREVEQGAARLESGQRFVCKIAADGAAACWGERSWEPCWWHSEDNCQAVHTASALPGDLMGIPGAIAVGDPCALRGDGKVVCPVVETDRKGAPEVVAGVSGARAVAGACALDGQGGVACWGERPRVAQRVALPAASQVVTGQGHACALVGGAVWCWGRGESGQLGDGTRPLSRAAAAPVRGLADAVELAAGDEFTCARRAGGGVVCWGRNVHGALGDGSGRDQAQPAVVAGLSDAVEVAARAERACARRAGGGVVCWGWHPAEQYLEVTAEAPVLVARP